MINSECLVSPILKNVDREMINSECLVSPICNGEVINLECPSNYFAWNLRKSDHFRMISYSQYFTES